MLLSLQYKHNVEVLFFLYDRVLKGFTLGEAIFMVLVSWQSLADFSALKKGIVLRRIHAVAFSSRTRSFG